MLVSYVICEIEMLLDVLYLFFLLLDLHSDRIDGQIFAKIQYGPLKCG